MLTGQFHTKQYQCQDHGLHRQKMKEILLIYPKYMLKCVSTFHQFLPSPVSYDQVEPKPIFHENIFNLFELCVTCVILPYHIDGKILIEKHFKSPALH